MYRKLIALVLILLGAIAFLGGCSGGDSSEGDDSGLYTMEEIGRITDLEELKNLQLVSLSVHGQVIDSADGVGDDQAEAESLSSIKDYVMDKLKAYFGAYFPIYNKVTYNTTNSSGAQQQVTGLMVIPASLKDNVSLPILSMQHPTQVLRKYSPSWRNPEDNEFTGILAGIIAMTGYIVVVADYPGMGDNYDVHPYCSKVLSNCVVDLIGVAINAKDELAKFKVEWNGKVVLLGYSEGGYATMVSAQKLQQTAQYPLDAVSPLDGPYSLSVTMKNVMLTADASYGAPYFLPYFVAGYESIYTPNITFSGAVKESVPDYTPPEGETYATMLHKLLDGSHDSSEINEFMMKATPYEGPKSVLQDSFISQLSDDTSFVCQALEDNNGYVGWTPTIPMKMFHNENDDYVPYDNMVQAKNNFPDSSNIEYGSFTEYIPISDSIHADSFPVAMVKGFLYVDKYGHPERH